MVTQGSPALRANPGLSDAIPLGFLRARSIPIVYATNHQIEINSSDAWGFDERPRREAYPINPEGIGSFSPGLRGTSSPGSTNQIPHRPRRRGMERVVAAAAG